MLRCNQLPAQLLGVHMRLILYDTACHVSPHRGRHAVLLFRCEFVCLAVSSSLQHYADRQGTVTCDRPVCTAGARCVLAVECLCSRSQSKYSIAYVQVVLSRGAVASVKYVLHLVISACSGLDLQAHNTTALHRATAPWDSSAFLSIPLQLPEHSALWNAARHVSNDGVSRADPYQRALHQMAEDLAGSQF